MYANDGDNVPRLEWGNNHYSSIAFSGKLVPTPSELVHGNISSISAEVSWNITDDESFEEVDHYNLYLQTYSDEEWDEIFDTEGILLCDFRCKILY